MEGETVPLHSLNLHTLPAHVIKHLSHGMDSHAGILLEIACSCPHSIELFCFSFFLLLACSSFYPGCQPRDDHMPALSIRVYGLTFHSIYVIHGISGCTEVLNSSVSLFLYSLSLQV